MEYLREKMLKTVFGYSPQVKTIDFLLSTYDGYFNKTQIANGAKISRPTLNKFIENLLEYGILKRIKGNTFELNNDSEIVKLFAKANLLLVEMELDKKSKNHVYEKIDYSQALL